MGRPGGELRGFENIPTTIAGDNLFAFYAWTLFFKVNLIWGSKPVAQIPHVAKLQFTLHPLLYSFDLNM